MLLLSALLIAASHTHAVASTPKSLVVFAASSLTNVLPEIAREWKKTSGTDVTFSVDATSTLARQVVSGAPADLFFSADEEWMNQLEKTGSIEPDTRTALVSNNLVIVVPADSPHTLQTLADLNTPWLKHLAMAGENVPAGKLARSALHASGTWNDLKGKVVSATNVRAALQWVARKEAQAGIVFTTDARTEPAVKVVFTFPAAISTDTQYQGAVLRRSTSKPEAAAFLRFCRGNEARKIFLAAGFTLPPWK